MKSLKIIALALALLGTSTSFAGGAATITATPALSDCGTVALNGIGSCATVTISRSQTAGVTTVAVAALSDTTNFRVESTDCSTLDAGTSTCTIQVSFRPSVEGPSTATLPVTYTNSTASPGDTLTFTGTTGAAAPVVQTYTIKVPL